MEQPKDFEDVVWKEKRKSCPQCGVEQGNEWNKSYHKMDCTAYDVIWHGKDWIERVR